MAMQDVTELKGVRFIGIAAHLDIWFSLRRRRGCWQMCVCGRCLIQVWVRGCGNNNYKTTARDHREMFQNVFGERTQEGHIKFKYVS